MTDLNVVEEWRPVEGWPYEVSSLGRVRRASPGARILISHPTRESKKNGYPHITLCGGSKKNQLTMGVHTLVALAFHGPRPPLHVVAHSDGDVFNARATNLRWATQSENEADKISHGTRLIGERIPSSILTWNEVNDLRFLFYSHFNGRNRNRGFIGNLSSQYGISYEGIRRIVRFRLWVGAA